MILTLFYSLLTMCVLKEGERMKLVIQRPIPLVRNALFRMCLFWEDAGDYISLSTEQAYNQLKQVPLHISRTGCTISQSRLMQQSLDYKRQLDHHRAQMREYRRQKELFDYNPALLEGGVLMSVPVFPDRYVIKSPEPLFQSDEEWLAYEQQFKLMDEYYLERFESLLYGIYLSVQFREKNAFVCDAARVVLAYGQDSVRLDLISTRPCLQSQDLRVATIVLWRVMAACVQFNIPEFRVVIAFESTRGLLTRLGGFSMADDRDCDYYISLEQMRVKTLAAMGLEGRLIENSDFPGFYKVVPHFFPSARDLNDTEEVERRIRFYSDSKRRRANARRAVRRRASLSVPNQSRRVLARLSET